MTLEEGLEEIYELIKSKALTKKKEYIEDGGGDFDAVELIAKACNLTPEKVCMVLSAKHFLSLCKKVDNYDYETVEEKTIDDIIYLEMMLIQKKINSLKKEKEDEETDTSKADPPQKSFIFG